MPKKVLTIASLISRVKVDDASHVLQRHPDQKKKMYSLLLCTITNNGHASFLVPFRHI